MTVKLLLTWDIIPGREQDYFEFVVQEFIPQVQRMGLEPTDAWFTVYGDQPQILAAVRARNYNNLQHVLASQEWGGLTNRLLDYVENLNVRTVLERPGFQM
ncbi:MAG: hypothetical protein JW862_07060 [Anaerolineales bacterium]|nr:hypothetical protein [Anaerolineales bacterium]